MAREEVRKVQKSGNAFYVTIPRAYLSYLGLTRKDMVVIRLHRDHITVSPYKPNEQRKGEKCPEK